MAKYILTLVFLGLLTVLFFYPTPGETLQNDFQFEQQIITPTDQKNDEKVAAQKGTDPIPLQAKEPHELLPLTLR